MTNPLLETWITPFGLAPFDRIKDTDFAPAFDAALASHKAEVDAIAANPATPDFDNTVGALARIMHEGLARVA
jgi:peptidyl-dipeptidase Dcp